ncbi:MAG TPA: DNA polymerase III subunit beta [Patescibacteria group bacterium]|jgi:DNA polymerase-3 subunit beta|nr:DNA polymerase III subunit beta [Patescibacteria group bacterium]
MKLVVTQENLSKALQVVGRVAGGKTPLPILKNILLKTNKSRLLLAATNLEIAITKNIGGKIEEPGAITVPAKLMSEFISNLPKDNVSLELDGTKLKISSASYQSTINGILPDEFPALPEITSDQTVTIPTALLKRAIQQTIIAASSDDTRPVLTGVFCHSYQGGLYLAATDGYRLAERLISKTDKKADQPISAIIPAHALQDVLRVINDDMVDTKLIFDENQVRLLLDDIEITSRLIDGKFPDYRQLIPATTDVQVVVDKDEFMRITKVASLFAQEVGGSVTLKINQTDQTLSVHAVASQLGENTSTTSAKVNADGQITLNSRYLLEALGCIDSSVVTFSFSGKVSPCVLRAEADTSDYKHIIMPLKS